MALCNITGTVYLPSGDLAAGVIITFRRNSGMIAAEYNGVVVPLDTPVQVDEAGGIDVDLLSGSYVAFSDRFYAQVEVPDEVSANFADIIVAV